MSTIKQVTIQTPLGETISQNIGADALNIDYDNSSSELESTNVQDAIDELKDDLSNFSSTLEDLDDVNLSNLQNEQVIKYNSTSQKWENGNVNISGKADKVSNATNGNFASLDANGNLTDSGKKASDFAGTGTATSSANGLMSSTDKTKLDNLGTASTKDVPTSGNAGSTQVVMGNDTRLSDNRKASDVYDWAKAATKPQYTASEVGAIATTAKGANNGVAELDSTGKVPSSQLPSFVDDVLEYDSSSAFPTTGETGKIYIAKDTNKTYRWSGTAYTEISTSLALGETSSTAYRGDRGKTAYDHSQSTHARTDATKVEASSTNGKIKINGTETTVYTHPGSGTNPHGTTKSDVGLGNVGNFKAVSTVASQGLSDTEKSNARANINAGTSNFSGNYNDLTNKPTIPTVNNATLTIQKNGANVQTFTANASSNVTANITVPTKTSDLTNDSNFVADANYVHTDNNFTTTLKNYLSGLENVVTLPIISYNSLPSKSTEAQVYFKEWLVYMIQNYKSRMRAGKIIVAPANPNSQWSVYGWCYTADEVNTTTGLPRYASFIAIPLGDTSPIKFGTNNYTYYYSNVDTNTWRGIQNNLTSDSTTESLSAAQGKALKALVDAKGTGTVTQVKVGSTAYNPSSGVISLPAYPTDTNDAVTQTANDSIDDNFEVLFSKTADNTTKTEGTYKSVGLRFNPYRASLMEGKNTLARGLYSHAEGYKTYASGTYSHAEGYRASASGISSHAEGTQTCAFSDGSHAEGYSTCIGYIVASGLGSHAEGYTTSTSGKTIASGLGSHAEGISTSATNDGAHTEGELTLASAPDSHAEGSYTYASGVFSHAEGIDTTASNRASHAEGNKTLASNSYSHAEGSETCAISLQSHAEGLQTRASGSSSHAEGQQTTASGDCSHTEGNAVCASGTCSHAEGSRTTATGNFGSHAEGYQTCASGISSHVEGYQTLTNDNYSHAEGYRTTASGINSHAEGYYTCASNYYSHSAGYKGAAYSNTNYYRDTTIISAKSIKFAFGTDAEASSTSSDFIDPNSNNAFSIDQQGSIFAKGAMGISRGYINGTLVANGPRIVLEDGASYILYTDTRNKSTGAWRGAQAYYIAGSWNPLGTGSSTTALAVPHAASIGAVGSCGVKLQLDTVSYTNNDTKYRGQLGIGSCGTAYGVRWNLVKVVGSDADFGY